jgi:arylsulfatase A-like enzyme
MKTSSTAQLVILLCLSTLAAEKPNVLLILSDDHSVSHVGAYGGPNCQRLNLTPNLDAFARESMRFYRAYVTAPQCAPARISVFTGRTPIDVNATRFGQPARNDVELVTDVFRNAGYWVGLDGRHQLEKQGVRGPAFESRFDHFVRGASTKAQHLATVPDKFAAALDKIPRKKPFFLYFGFNQPHRKFGDDHDGIDPAKLTLPPDFPDLPELRLDYAKFLAEVRDLDTGFGMVMDVLKQRGLADNTIVVFMGDNGESLLRGKGTVWDRGLRVPLMVRWPGRIPENSISNALVCCTDIAPTLLDAAGLAPPPGMTGGSYLKVLTKRTTRHRDFVFAERSWHHGPVTRTDGFDLSRAVITPSHHFIYNVLPDRPYVPVAVEKLKFWPVMQSLAKNGKLSTLHKRLYFPGKRPLFELYDVAKDPFQLRNLAGSSTTASIEKELREVMDRWLVRENDFVPLPSHAAALSDKH